MKLERVPPWARVSLFTVLALAGTMLLYQGAVRLPFFFDDMIHLRWLDWHSLPSVWTTAEGLGYYRPLTMSVWKVGDLILGRNEPALFHLLNLLLHALNATLTGYVAWRVWQGRGRFAFALLVCLLFLTYPFSYQAVPSTSSLSKPLHATLVLTSVLLYWEGRRRKSRLLVGLSLFVGALAPFAYEGGVMVPLAILSVELLEWYRGEFEHLSWQPLLYGLLIWGVVLPTIVLMEPETGAALRLPSLTSLWRNGAFFLQGLAFPLTMLSTPLEEVLSIDRYLLLMLVSLLGLFTAVAVYRWAKPAGLGLYALSWFAVGILPQWLMLDFAYVITSPRLLYLAAVGSALLWAGMPVLLWTRSAGRKLPKALAAIGVTGLLVFSVIYVRDKMALAETAASPLHQASDVASEWGNEASLLFVNVPAWIAPKDPTYRGGTEGLTFIPEYVGVRDFVYVNSGVDAAIKAVMFEPVKKDWEAYIGYAGQPLGQEEMIEEIRKADAVFLTTYDSGGLRFLEAGALELSGSVRSEALPLARFGREIMLLGRRVETFSTELRMSLWWQCQQVPEGDLTVFAHVYDRSGQLVAQMDGYPLAGLYTIQSCQPGDVIRDIRHIILPGDSSNRHYSVAVGWYDRVTGERLPVFDSRGRPVAHDAFVVHDHIPSQSDSLPPE